MKFKDLLLRAKSGDQDAIHTILEMYRPLLLKESIVLGVFDEDLYPKPMAADRSHFRSNGAGHSGRCFILRPSRR